MVSAAKVPNNSTTTAARVHGRVFQTIDDVREAVGARLADRYNAEWLIEKNLTAPHARPVPAAKETLLKRGLGTTEVVATIQRQAR